jgi:hypothetical protein
MKCGERMTLQKKWESKFNSVVVQKSLQDRLKNQMKNAVVKKRSGNKGE